MKVILNKFYEKIAIPYVESKIEEIDELKNLASNENFSGLEVIGHKLAGTAGSYMLFGLGDLGAMLEEKAAEGKISECNEIILNIEKYLNELEIEFEKWKLKVKSIHF